MTESTPATGTKVARKVHIETWGCQMNIADSEKMLALLQAHNYTATCDVGEADLIVLNTCHIREKATHKVISRLGVLRLLKEEKPGLIIAVAGCIPQMEAAQLMQSSGVIDIALGPGRLGELPELILEFEVKRSPVIALGFGDELPTDLKGGGTFVPHKANPMDTLVPLEVHEGKNPISRYVTIMQGCENFCTYCVVPYTRGKERSRPVDEIVREVELLIANGAREITLLGQNVNSYGLKHGASIDESSIHNTPFVDLVLRVLALKQLESLRFTTSNPHNFPLSLAQLFGAHPRLGKHLHLPVQSGSNAVLARMRRKITVEQYRQRIGWVRERLCDIALSTDLIVGFPGETDREFEETLDLVRDIRFSFLFAFKYSPRTGTPAATYEGQLPERVKEERLERLLKMQDAITLEHNQALIGRQKPVLVQYVNKREKDSYYGRTDCFRLVKLHSPTDIIGQTVTVVIEEAGKTTLVGRI